jgi:hypothetical protein
LVIADATTSAKGVVELATSGETAAGVVVQGNDARLSDARTPTTHVHAAADITSGTMATARLGSGTANSTTFLRGDQTYAVPAGGVTERWARARRLTNVTIPVTSETVVVFDTEDADTDVFYDTTNGRATVPAGLGGSYRVGLGIRFATLSSGVRLIALRLNGTTWLSGATSSGIASVNMPLNCWVELTLAAGDYVQGIAYSTVAVDVIAELATFLVIRKLS